MNHPSLSVFCNSFSFYCWKTSLKVPKCFSFCVLLFFDLFPIAFQVWNFFKVLLRFQRSQKAYEKNRFLSRILTDRKMCLLKSIDTETLNRHRLSSNCFGVGSSFIKESNICRVHLFFRRWIPRTKFCSKFWRLVVRWSVRAIFVRIHTKMFFF